MSNEKEKRLKIGDEYQVTAEGSLGLLALGYRGVQAWRKARKEANQKASGDLLISKEKKEK
jgi:hypothetical protein